MTSLLQAVAIFGGVLGAWILFLIGAVVDVRHRPGHLGDPAVRALGIRVRPWPRRPADRV